MKNNLSITKSQSFGECGEPQITVNETARGLAVKGSQNLTDNTIMSLRMEGYEMIYKGQEEKGLKLVKQAEILAKMPVRKVVEEEINWID